MQTYLVSVTAIVRVTVQDGANPDEDTVKLAADTAARHETAKSESMTAEVLMRERRFVGP